MINSKPPTLAARESFRTSLASSLMQPREKTAAVCQGRSLTYLQFRQAVGAARHSLTKLVKPGDRVALWLEPDLECVVAMTACILAGITFVPLSSELPQYRVDRILEDCAISLILTGPVPFGASIVPSMAIDVSDRGEPPAMETGTDFMADTGPAYIIYTSGTTGKPKGVAIGLAALSNTLTALVDMFALTGHDVFLSLSDVSFDLFVFDIFAPLLVGGTVVLPGKAVRREPKRLLDVVSQHNVTVWNSVPAQLDLMLGGTKPVGQPGSLRLVMLSGDVIKPELVNAAREAFPEAILACMGGATEAAIWSTLHIASGNEGSFIPYGDPLPGQATSVRRADLTICHVGEAGELAISGDSLADCYWNDPETTAAKFPVVSGERIYLTGDRVMFDDEGQLAFLGRIDSQVKINGFRIELAEVEQAAAGHPFIRSAVATAFSRPGGEVGLALHVILDTEEGDAREEIRDYLRALLPPYMLPSLVRAVDSYPLTTNGKVDRAKLREAAENLGTAPAPGASIPGNDDIQTAVVLHIMRRALNDQSLGPTSDLLDLGFTSLDLVRAANALEEAVGFRPLFEDFYRDATVGAVITRYASFIAGLRDRLQEPEQAASACWSGATDAQDPEVRNRIRCEATHTRRAGILAAAISSSDIARPARALTARRRSARKFDAAPLEFDDFMSIAAALCPPEGRDQHSYPSAGGIYGVEAFFNVRSGKVSGIGEGVYWLDRHERRLHCVGPSLDSTLAHVAFNNRRMYADCCAEVFMFADARLLVRLYGERARDFAMIESGYMAQAVLTCGAGEASFLPIGSMDGEVLSLQSSVFSSLTFTHALLVGSRSENLASHHTEGEDIADLSYPTETEKADRVRVVI